MVKITNLINVSLSYSLASGKPITLPNRGSFIVTEDAQITEGLRDAAALDYIKIEEEQPPVEEVKSEELFTEPKKKAKKKA